MENQPAALEHFYLQHNEPVKGCLFALREMILNKDADVTEAWKYRMPFFCYKGKMFCFLWIDKRTGDPYLGFVEGKRIIHPHLIAGTRKRMKILKFDAAEDLPVKTINTLLIQALDLYKNGIVKIKM